MLLTLTSLEATLSSSSLILLDCSPLQHLHHLFCNTNAHGCFGHSIGHFFPSHLYVDFVTPWHSAWNQLLYSPHCRASEFSSMSFLQSGQSITKAAASGFWLAADAGWLSLEPLPPAILVLFFLWPPVISVTIRF